MPQVKVRVPKGTELFHSDLRSVIGHTIKMKSIHDTCETLMALSQENLSSEQLERALTSYKELSDMTARERDLLDRVQLMLKVIGQNLMEFQIDGPSHST